jgi:hypothetical protein
MEPLLVHPRCSLVFVANFKRCSPGTSFWSGGGLRKSLFLPRLLCDELQHEVAIRIASRKEWR